MDRFSETDPFDLRDRRYWQEGPPEPFFVVSEPCESCGKPCESREVASWAPDLMVGPCCIVEEVEVPSTPRCLEEYRLLDACNTLQEISEVVGKHREQCPFCKGQRKGMGHEVGRVERREVA